jgi:hypothetical protein
MGMMRTSEQDANPTLTGCGLAYDHIRAGKHVWMVDECRNHVFQLLQSQKWCPREEESGQNIGKIALALQNRLFFKWGSNL